MERIRIQSKYTCSLGAYSQSEGKNINSINGMHGTLKGIFVVFVYPLLGPPRSCFHYGFGTTVALTFGIWKKV